MNRLNCGRAHRLWAPMAEEISTLYQQGERISLLVPEQYTLQAERDLMRDLGIRGFFRLDVLSLSRLEYRVFDQLGQDARVRIDERGRAMTVARALRKAQKELHYYAGAEERPGFIRKMAVLIASLKSLGLDAAALEEAAQQVQGRGLGFKLGDTARVFRQYARLLEGRFADQQDIHQDMLSRLAAGRPMAGRHVFLYGFDLLTDPLLELLLVLSRQCASLNIYLVSEKAQAEDGDSFESVRHSAQRLLDAWREERLPHQFNWLPDTPVSEQPELIHLERHLLGMEQPMLDAPVPAMRLHAAATPHQEVRLAAEWVQESLRLGTDPEDIYVLAGSLPMYGGLLRSTFRRYGIPCFVAQKVPLTAHRLVRHVLSALRCVADGWRTEDLLDLMKAGLTSLSEADVWQLEHYVLSHGIRTSRWLKPFARGSQEARAAAEALRLRLIPPLERLKEGLLAARSAAESLAALQAYMKEEELTARAQALEAALRVGGLPAEAAQVPQVMDQMLEMFTQMAALMGEERIPLKYFALWLESGLQEVEIGSLPPVSGQVQVGELGNLLLPRPRVVILLGLNEGILDAQDAALLTPQEQAFAQQTLRLQLGLDLAGKQELKVLDFWKALSAPRERLYLSYALANEEGGALHPLQQVAAIRRMFPQLKEEGGSQQDMDRLPSAPGPALDELAALLRGGALDGLWAQAWGWMQQEGPWRQKAQRLAAETGPQPKAPPLLPQAAARLYPEDRVSVSRLETFAACAFQHFVDHALRPQIREEWVIEPVDTGSFYHQAMESYVRLALQDPQWPQVDEKHSDRLVAQAVAPLTAAWEEAPFADTARQRKVSEGYVELARGMAWMLTRGAQISAFRPDGVELRFGGEGEEGPLLLPLPQGRTIALSGTIDRLDRYVGELGDYLRVVDYKSSAQGVVWERIWLGTQLQLLVYLHRALSLYPASQAAGAFYQRLTDPLIHAEEEEQALTERDKEYRLKGLVLEDKRVVELMDATEEFTLGPLYKKDGTPRKGSMLVPKEELKLLTDFSIRRAAQLGQRILAGDIARDPVMDKNRRTPCDWCLYRGICRIDPARPGAYRRMAPMEKADLLQRIRGEDGA